jgi:hypothetical protein
MATKKKTVEKESLRVYEKKICDYIKKSSFVLTKKDREELYSEYHKKREDKDRYTKRSFDAILMGARYNKEVADYAHAYITHRIDIIHKLGKQFERDRRKMKAIAAK